MTPHRKKCPYVVHFNVPRDWFETNLRHQKRYSEGGKKIRGCLGLLGRVIVLSTEEKQTLEWIAWYVKVNTYPWMAIDPVHSVIQPLNSQGLVPKRI